MNSKDIQALLNLKEGNQEKSSKKNLKQNLSLPELLQTDRRKTIKLIDNDLRDQDFPQVNVYSSMDAENPKSLTGSKDVPNLSNIKMLTSRLSKNFRLSINPSSPVKSQSVERIKMIKQPHINRGVTIKGKTYKRKDIIWLKEYYDSVDSGAKGYMSSNIMHSTLPSLSSKNIGQTSSRENAQNGKVSFREMLKKAIPGARKEDINKMLDWIRKEEEIIERGVINYKMPKYLNIRPKGNKNINFKQLKDYLHIFESLDKDHDCLLDFDDLRNNYSHILTDKDFESFFTRFGKTRCDHLTLDEYLTIMLPQGSVIGKIYLQKFLCSLLLSKTML